MIVAVAAGMQPNLTWNPMEPAATITAFIVQIQMFNWVSRPGTDFHANAAAAGVVLITLTLGMNAVAIAVRYRTRKRIRW